MNKKELYELIMKKVSQDLKQTLNEGLRHNVGKVTMLAKPIQVSNVDLNEPIFTDYQHSLWFRNFVLKGGGAFVEKRQGMDSHTFVCNTVESHKMLQKWLSKYAPEYIVTGI